MLGEEDISQVVRSRRMDMLSSAVSAVGEVREAMVELQRKIASGRRVVAEGRDMGTVVFPGAKHKFYLTATPEVRAERRYRERLERGENVSLEQVKEELHRRDRQDAGRSLAPLKPAEDAATIDSSDLNVDEVIAKIMGNIEG
jgi:cytidylate kinase